MSDIEKTKDLFKSMFDDAVVETFQTMPREDIDTDSESLYTLTDEEVMGDEWMRLRYTYMVGDDEGYELTVDIQGDDEIELVTTHKDPTGTKLTENTYTDTQPAAFQTAKTTINNIMTSYINT